METRVYAIVECDDVHDISNEKFIEMAEELGYVWSLDVFQNELNCEGSPSIPSIIISDKNLHFRFIDVPTEKQIKTDLTEIENIVHSEMQLDEDGNLLGRYGFGKDISEELNNMHNVIDGLMQLSKKYKKYIDCNCGDGNGVLKEHCDCDDEEAESFRKKNPIYAVLNEDRGGDTDVTLHRSYKSAKKMFDQIVKELKEIRDDLDIDLEDIAYSWDLSEKHLGYDLGDSWGNIMIIEEKK